MGATVVTSKKVAAFRRADGEIIFVLYEQTYEKNCHPHTPHWGARGIGTYDDVMRRVFDGAAACEGGGLQTRSGQTTPEAYLQSWRNEFKAPLWMPDEEIELTLGGTSMYSTIGDEHNAEAVSALNAIGRQDLVTRLQAGPVTLQLHADVDVLIALYGVRTNIPLWKILRYGPPHSSSSETLAPAKRVGQITAPSVGAFKLDKESVIVSIGGAPYENMGWVYSAVGQYMREIVLPLELRSDGVARKLIGAFRDKLKAAPEIPGSTAITVTPAGGDHRHYIDKAKNLAVKLGIATENNAVPATFKVTFGEVKKADELYLLSTLQANQVHWEVALDDDTSNILSRPAIQQFQGEQVSLF